MAEETGDWLLPLKKRVRNHPRLYYSMITIVSPTYYAYFRIRQRLKHFDLRKGVILNVGSGPVSMHPDTINIDIERCPNVHIQADAVNLPVKDDSVDGVLNVVLLEHLPDPEKAVDEMYRVLKKGGVIQTYVPLIYGYHASPNDYYRWTVEGAERLHRRFEKIDIDVSGGPTSSLICILTEWLAMLFSFGSVTLYRLFYICFTLTLWPFKFLDILLARHPMAKNISTEFCYTGRK